MPQLNVHLLPQLVEKSALAGSAVAMIDLLRASTTIVHALAAGCRSIVPFVDVDEVQAAAWKQSTNPPLLCGERGGKRLPGFDLGNSPADYVANQVEGKELFFTTTNGTKALHHARLAEIVLVAAAANRTAIADTLAESDRIDILCAGTDGAVTREDVLLAGALADQLVGRGARRLNDSAWLALDAWQNLINTAQAAGTPLDLHFAEELARGGHGRRLIELGFEDDLQLCARLDSHDVIPRFDPARGVINLATAR